MSELLIEVPHGASLAEFRALAARLRVPPLEPFFLVNTDAGAPELAEALAERRRARGLPTRVVRCTVPRTFVDTNRVLDARPEDYRAGGVTPGIPPYVREDVDRALLVGLHADYQAEVEAAAAPVMAAGGRMLLLHTYAPRSLDVTVDDDIVANLRKGWATPDRWPLRPPVDLIARDAEGRLHAPEGLLRGLRHSFGALGLEVGDSRTYPMHPSTTGYHHAMRWPGRVACVELRRDLLTARWRPFEPLLIDPARLARLAAALDGALGD